MSIPEALAESMPGPVHVAEVCDIYNMLPVLGDRVKSPLSGRSGYFLMNIYSSPPGDEPQTPVETLELDDSNIALYDYSHPSCPDNVLYATIEAILTVEHTDDYVFGLTVAGTAKLFIDDDPVVENCENQTRGKSFFGSGSIEETGRRHLHAGTTYRLRAEFGSAATSSLNSAGAPVFGAGGLRIGCARCADESLDMDAAVELARSVEQVVLCVGLGPEWESEGSDRACYELPGRQGELVSRVCAVNPRAVVVVQSGTPVGGPWDEAPAVMQAWYGGNESGRGVADVLLGRACPSGKLPVSWPARIEDNPAFLSFRAEAGRCRYSEDVYVGYRFYDTVRRAVQWPFGHGLSYASFEMRDLTLKLSGAGLGSELDINVAVTNTSSSVDGSETCQVYVARKSPSKVARPLKELKSFSKVFLSAGETKVVSMRVSLKYATSIWDETRDCWLMEQGEYQLLIGNSSAYTPLSTDFHVCSSLRWNGL